MKKLIVLFSLFICCAMSASAKCHVPDLYAGAGEWIEGEPFTMQVCPDPVCYILVQYCYKYNPVTGDREIWIDPLTSLTNPGVDQEVLKHCLLDLDKNESEYIDRAINYIVFGPDSPFGKIPLELCPK